MIWLASYPRSGNTFLRIILHEVYGIESSTFHQETAYAVDSGYEKYLAVKTHLLPSQLIPRDPNIPAVYLVRDGRDALVSMAHHRSDLIAPGSDYRSNLCDAIIAAKGSFFGGWSENVKQWLKRASVVIRFEELIVNPIACVERLRPLLDLPEPNLAKLPTFSDLREREMPYGNGLKLNPVPEERVQRRNFFFRRGQVGAWQDEMPQDLQNLFWRLHGGTMEMLGYPREQSWAQQMEGHVLFSFSRIKNRLTRIKALKSSFGASIRS